jgi:hypothetical protein
VNDRDELAQLMYIADNSNQSEEEALEDWALYTEDLRDTYTHRMADAILAAGYRKPRTITTPYQLESLPFGSAVQTSDESDTVVLRCDGNNFRNQSGYELSATDLWRYGTRPFTVLYEPEPQP